MNHRRELFVSYYTGECEVNATAAAKRAGYSDPEGTGRRLIRDPEVNAAIAEKAREVAMGQEAILARLGAIAAASLEHFVKLGPDGNLVADAGGRMLIDWGRAYHAGKLGMVRKVVPTKFGTSVEFHDRVRVLELLGRYHGIWKDRLTLDVPDLAKLSDAELEAIATGRERTALGVVG